MEEGRKGEKNIEVYYIVPLLLECNVWWCSLAVSSRVSSCTPFSHRVGSPLVFWVLQKI